MNKLMKYIKHPSKLILVAANRGFFNWMPDVLYLKTVFRIRCGYGLDLKYPRTFNEKIQWLKINDRNPAYTTMVDKFEAKKFVASIVGDEYIIPTLGVWDGFEEIDFESLPDRFVLKCTHDSGGLIICKDKSGLDIPRAKKTLNRSLCKNYYYMGREWPYKDVKPRIIAEEYLENNGEGGLVDYKFFCFNGVPRLLYVSKGMDDHKTASISFYDLEGKEMSFHRSDYKPLEGVVFPSNYDMLVSTAKRLASEIKSAFVRIDLYSVNGSVLFSEITFSPCSGMIPFEPTEWDRKLGEWLVLSK